jgi:hypothetical protein
MASCFSTLRQNYRAGELPEGEPPKMVDLRRVAAKRSVLHTLASPPGEQAHHSRLAHPPHPTNSVEQPFPEGEKEDAYLSSVHAIRLFLLIFFVHR